jgi:predicted RNase H-like nuclease (RuvC/YqgF family)
MTYAGIFDEMDLSHKFRKLKRENRGLKKENKKLIDEIEELKANLARAKEDHQYDNLVHKHELESLRKK